MERAGKKYWKALVNIGVAALGLFLLLWLLPRAFTFFAPFVVGWIISLIAAPLVRFFDEKLKIKRKMGSAMVIVVVIALVVLIIYLIGANLAAQILGLMESLPDVWESVQADLTEVGSRMELLLARLPFGIHLDLGDMVGKANNYVGEVLGTVSTPTIEAVGSIAKSLPSVIIGIIMGLLSAYFFVAEREQINEWFRNKAPKSFQVRYGLIRKSLMTAVGGYFKAQLKIEIWIYLLLVLGFGILGVKYFLLIALGIAILDFLPFFGTGTVMVPWAIIKALSGDYRMTVGLLIIWGVGQLVRQIIQPKIVGDSVGVPPIQTLFLLFVGYKLGGVLGMIIAVPIGLIVYTLYLEGGFDTTKNSILILVEGINGFRKLEAEDLPREKKCDEEDEQG